MLIDAIQLVEVEMKHRLERLPEPGRTPIATRARTRKSWRRGSRR